MRSSRSCSRCAVSVVGVAVFARARRPSIVGVIRLGRPRAGRRDQPGERWRHLLTETLGHTRMLQWNTIGVAHWFVFVAFGALFFTLDHRVRSAVRPAVRAAADRPLGGLRVGQRDDRLGRAGRHRLLDHHPALPRATAVRQSRFFGSRTWQAVYVELTILGIVVCVIVLRGLEYQLLGAETIAGALPVDLVRDPAGIARRRRSATGDRRRRRRQDHHLDGLVHHHRPEHHDGCGLAPVHRLAEHLVQARVVGTAGARRAAADHGRRTAVRLRRDRGPRRGHRARRRQDRGLHLEGPAGLHLLHRVRPLPVASARPGTPTSRSRPSC